MVRHLGDTHRLSLVVAMASMALLLIIERFANRIPAALAALAMGIAVSAAFGLERRGVAIVGELPRGLMAPQWPSVSAHDWQLLIPELSGWHSSPSLKQLGPLTALGRDRCIAHRGRCVVFPNCSASCQRRCLEQS